MSGPSILAGLLGANISGSLSPVLHESEARAQGFALVYRIIDGAVVPTVRQSWSEALRRAADLGYDALNVTVPAKQAVLEALDEIAPDAAALGAVNTVLFREGRMIGHNTDHAGFVDGLRANVPGADLSRVVQVGAGGAGSAVAYGVLREGAGALTVADLDLDRAEALAARMRAHFPAADIRATDLGAVVGEIAQATGLVNTTPVGMEGHIPGSPVPLESLHDGLWVADAVYKPRVTELIGRARELGCRTADGGGMIVGQAARSFTLFTGREADPRRMADTFDRATAG